MKILNGSACWLFFPLVLSAAPDPAALQAELLQVETDFCALAQREGVPIAFAHYAADNAAFFDLDPEQYRGQEAVRLRFADAPAGAVLTWKPVEAEVAASGELGYTWGNYEYRGPPDAEGQRRVGTGHYVTIWKKQADGNWRFVLDTGSPNPPARK